MRDMKFCYEVYPTEKFVPAECWERLIAAVSEFQKPFSHWRIVIVCKSIKVHYYLETDFVISASLRSLPNFLFQTAELPTFQTNLAQPFYLHKSYSFIDFKTYLKVNKNFNAQVFEFRFYKTFSTWSASNSYVHGKKKSYLLLPSTPSILLAANFSHNPGLTYKSPPRYLDAQKALPLLHKDAKETFLAVDIFPYYQTPHYLNQTAIDFDRHSLVLGASGSGKSKFLSLLVDHTVKNSKLKAKYRFVIIDPHAALEQEIGGLGRVIDFLNTTDSANLFSSQTEDPVVAVELLLDIFKGLIANNYNPKLERVLRHSLYLLLTVKKFDFHNLRKLLLDLDFRNQLLQTFGAKLPDSVTTFFYTEFSEIKVRSYTEAISPIIALVDEVEMIPVFTKEPGAGNISEVIQQNFLTIFSLDRTKFGDRVVKIIAGLIMQQILTLAEQHTFSEHLILIVDEVAVVENPILCRFLAEARKYHLSVILAGQYFGGVSPEFRQAIFANVTNYYIFRIAKDDANLIVHNFDMKIPLDDTIERKIKTLTELQNRECIVRISAENKLIPAFKCTTLDFTPQPRQQKSPQKVETNKIETPHQVQSSPKVALNLDSSFTLREVLTFTASSEKHQQETSVEFLRQKLARHNQTIKYHHRKEK